MMEGEKVRTISVARLWETRRKTIYPLIAVVFFWQLLTFFFPPYLIPSVFSIAREMGSILTDFSLMVSYLFTIYRVILALTAAFLTGTMISILIFYHSPSRDFILTLFHFMMGVPSLSWVVMAVIWFSNVEFRVFYIVFVTSLPMFALQVDDAVRAVSNELIEMLKIFRPNRRQLLTKLIFPAILPSIFTSWKVNLGFGVRVVIVAELVGATVGVGNELLTAQELFRMESAIAWTLMLVLFMLVTEQVIIQIESHVLRYRPVKALT